MVAKTVIMASCCVFAPEEASNRRSRHAELIAAWNEFVRGEHGAPTPLVTWILDEYRSRAQSKIEVSLIQKTLKSLRRELADDPPPWFAVVDKALK